jgi:hypothetical protein
VRCRARSPAKEDKTSMNHHAHLALGLCLAAFACGPTQGPGTTTPADATGSSTTGGAAAETGAEGTTAATAEGTGSGQAAPTATPSAPITEGSPTPADGATTFFVYDAFLSPLQEGGEESERPKALRGLASTEPSVERAKRGSRGYGQVRFARDLSKAIVELQIEGVRSEDIVMFHIHCGPPGVLGPIIVDFGEVADLAEAFADGQHVLEIRNENVKVAESPKTLKPHLPEGCPIDKGLPTQAKTIGGLEHLARKGVLYFNLHTKAHTYYGEMRGQLYLREQ